MTRAIPWEAGSPAVTAPGTRPPRYRTRRGIRHDRQMPGPITTPTLRPERPRDLGHFGTLSLVHSQVVPVMIVARSGGLPGPTASITLTLEGGYRNEGDRGVRIAHR